MHVTKLGSSLQITNVLAKTPMLMYSWSALRIEKNITNFSDYTVHTSARDNWEQRNQVLNANGNQTDISKKTNNIAHKTNNCLYIIITNALNLKDIWLFTKQMIAH